MFKTRDFLPIIFTVIAVIGLSLGALAWSGACAGEASCWVISPLEILFGRYQVPSTLTSSLNYVFLVLTAVGGKAILLVGAFLSAVNVVVSALRHDFRAARARRMTDHTIVCGLGETGMQVVRNMRSAGRPIVVIDQNDAANSAACDQMGLAVIKGDATDGGALRLAGARNAATFIVATGEDATNVEVALQARDIAIAERSGHQTLILAEIRNRELFARFENHDRHALGHDHVELRLFNVRENAARLLLRSLPSSPGPELGIDSFSIFGFGPVGEEILLQVIRAPLAVTGSKPRIIIFDRDAANHEHRIRRVYPALARLADISFVQAQLSPDQVDDWEAIGELLKGTTLLGAAICCEDDEANLCVALNLRRVLDNLVRIHVPIFVQLGRLRHLGQFAFSMEEFEGATNRLKPFGGLDEILGSDILVMDELDAVARAMHSHYRSSRDPARGSYPGDRPWNQLPESLKMANRHRADGLRFLLSQAELDMVPSAKPALVELDRAEIERLAQLEHRRWMIERQLLGYAHGETRSHFGLRHALLVDWEALPEAERERNRSEIAAIPATLAAVGYELRRRHKILAIGNALKCALAALEAGMEGGNERCLVVADVDSEDGRKAANLAVGRPNTELWLVSSDHPANFRDLPQIEGVLKSAAGWITRDQLRIQ
jgi:hypothetical protein